MTTSELSNTISSTPIHLYMNTICLSSLGGLCGQVPLHINPRRLMCVRVKGISVPREWSEGYMYCTHGSKQTSDRLPNHPNPYTDTLPLPAFHYKEGSFSYIMHTMSYRMHFNFHGIKLSQIVSFRDFRSFNFTVFDVSAGPLPVWSKFSQDETFVDGC